jgi:propionyl-CoA carboxylase alpha chain
VVVVGATGTNQHVPVDVVEFTGHSGFAAIKMGEIYDIESSSRMNDMRIAGTVNGVPFTAQIERGTAKSPLAFVVQHNGTKIEALVMAPNVAELHQTHAVQGAP